MGGKVNFSPILVYFKIINKLNLLILLNNYIFESEL